jgi:RNA polymerase sigma-70 factor (ECF subfamily)
MPAIIVNDMPNDADALDDLARRAAQDPALLDELIRQVQPQVIRICQRVLPHRADAEDACQDALLAIATKIGTFSGRSRFSTWVHVVASNAARETYLRLKRRAAENPAAWHDDDRLDALEHLETDLPETVTSVVLRDIYELSYDEIADQVGVPVGTVKSRISRARVSLKAQLLPQQD